MSFMADAGQNTSPWSSHFTRLLKASGLKNSMKGFGHQPSWPSNMWFMRIPLDHMLYSDGITIHNRMIGRPVGSDHLPVIADPSHGTGKRELVDAVAKAAMVAGADGLIVEVHPHPDRALSDGAQSLTIEAFGRLVGELRLLGQAMGRTL